MLHDANGDVANENSSEQDAAAEAPDAAAAMDGVGPSPTGDGSPYSKPNLVLSDPDPYAFAHRIRRLVMVFGLLAVVAAGPYLAKQISYHWHYGQQRAKSDIAKEELPEAVLRLADFSRASRLVVDRISPAVVSIRRPSPIGNSGQGSGVIVDPQGYIVTNFHVIDGATELLVRLEDNRVTDAVVVGADPATDLAVLKIDLPNLIAAEWGDSNRVQVGDMVWAVGSPFGLPRSITFGIVSAKERRSSNRVRTSSIYQEYLQTDVAINPGNSGGPLVSLDGKVVGINTAIIGEAYQGISFAIPSTFARETYDLLKEKGWIERGFLGVTPRPVPDSVRTRLQLNPAEGVYVAGVEPSGPASRAGLRPGDVILRWNDHDATDPTLLSRAIAATDVGSSADVVVKRFVQGSPRELPLEVRVGRSPLNLRVRGGR